MTTRGGAEGAMIPSNLAGPALDAAEQHVEVHYARHYRLLGRARRIYDISAYEPARQRANLLIRLLCRFLDKQVLARV